MFRFLQRFKMNTIFWKIFLSIWVSMIAITAVTTVTVSLLMDRDHIKSRGELIDNYQASSAMSLYETGGAAAFRSWLRERHRPIGRFTFLVNSRGKDVLGRPLPPPVVSMLRQGNNGSGFGQRHRYGVVLPLTASDGSRYWYVRMAAHPKPGGRSGFWHSGRGSLRAIIFITALLVSGLISFWLARNITSPIRQLQRTTQQISRGDLSTRVAPEVALRRDEIGDLGREFDRMAEHIEDLISAQKRMLRDVSHELRSPLARLQVALELARKVAGSSGAAEHDRIEKEANRLNDLIGQVLSLVRLSASGSKLSIEEVDIEQLVQQIVEDADFEAAPMGKRVALANSFEKTMTADMELLHSALENVIRNAVLYTAKETTVEVSMSEGQEGAVLISVLDFGEGVSEKALGHLFEPFYREAEARDRTSGGYGLGLAIAKRAVQLHGGKITAENISGAGLQIEIYLPDLK